MTSLQPIPNYEPPRDPDRGDREHDRDRDRDTWTAWIQERMCPNEEAGAPDGPSPK